MSTTSRSRTARIALAVTLGIAGGVAGIAGCGSHSSSAPSCASVLRTIAPVTAKGERAASGSPITVDAASAGFDPTCVTGVPRGVVAVAFRNTGLVIHNVDIPAQHIDTDIKPGLTVTIPIRVDNQPVVYFCRYHRQLGMIGVLIPAQ